MDGTGQEVLKKRLPFALRTEQAIPYRALILKTELHRAGPKSKYQIS
jgi:hypothetical protein